MNEVTRVIIVDDSYEKPQIIASVLKDIPNIKFDHCSNAKEAILKLRNNQYSIMIIDMQIPNELGDDIDRQGGRKLLEFVSINEFLHRPLHIIGITSHSDSFEECKNYFEINGWHLLLGVQEKNILSTMIKSKIRHSPKKMKFDIAIITALRRVEFDAVMRLDCKWQLLRMPNDNNIYYSGKIFLENGDVKSVVATCCSRMGMTSASAVTMKVCNKFSPETVIMTGICAGVKSKTNFGDVIVADPCWDWGSGKVVAEKFSSITQNSPHQMPLNASYRTLFQDMSARRLYLDEIANGWMPNRHPGTIINLHVGPMATGAVVLEDPETLKKIVSQNRETISVEMEAYGVSYAASISNANPPVVIIIKSVCDFANSEKNDDWQEYAAYTSAQFTYKFIVNHYLN